MSWSDQDIVDETIFEQKIFPDRDKYKKARGKAYMSSKLSGAKLLKSMLAVLIVFLMSAGAFISAAENDTMEEISDEPIVLPVNTDAGVTTEDDLAEILDDEPDDVMGSEEEGVEYPSAMIPTIDPVEDIAGLAEGVTDTPAIDGDELVNADDGLLVEVAEEPESVPKVTTNSLSNALGALRKPGESSESVDNAG